MVSFANTMLSHLAYQNKPDFTYLRQISGVAHIRVQCVHGGGPAYRKFKDNKDAQLLHKFNSSK